MKKLAVLGLVAAFAFGAFVLGGPVAARAETIELKFAHFMSPKHIQHRKSFAPYCKKVEEITGGKVKIKIYPGGALGRPKQLPDAVKAGITDIAFIIPAYTTARFPRISVMDLPFLADSALQSTRIVYDLLDGYFAEDFKDYKVLWFYSSGPGQFMSATKPMHTIEDLKGMKMRTPSAYMSKAFKLINVNPVGMPIPKLTMSLQKKVIDGMLTPFSAVKDFRLFDLVKHITVVNMYVTPMAVVMNKEKFNALPDYAKKALNLASGKQWGLHAAKVYDEHDQNTTKEIEERGKIKIYSLTDSEKNRLKGELKVMESNWVAEIAKKRIPAGEILKAVHASAGKNK